MLKIIFWLLLLANGVLFALQRGYVGPTARERYEPTRWMQQLHPETLSILPPHSEKLKTPAKTVPEATDGAAQPPDASTDATPLATAAPLLAAAKADATSAPPAQVIACTEIGNFNPDEARRFEARLNRLRVKVKPVSRNVQEVASHIVYLPAQDGKEGADRKAAELRRLGIQDFYIMSESSGHANLRWGISLGVFKTEAAAKAFIGQLIAKGVRSARIMARSVTSTRQAYQWRDMDAATQAALVKLKAAFPNQEVRNCPG